MSDQESYTGPRYIPEIHPRPGLLKVSAIAALMVEPGLPKTKAEAQVRAYLHRGYLEPVGTDATDARGSYLYSLDQALVAKVLSILADAGLDLKDRDGVGHGVGATVARRLNYWNRKDIFGKDDDGSHDLPEGVAHSPAAQIIVDYFQHRRNGWSVRARWSRHAETGRREMACSLRDIDRDYVIGAFRDDPLIVPHSEHVILLERVLPRITSDPTGLH